MFKILLLFISLSVVAQERVYFIDAGLNLEYSSVGKYLCKDGYHNLTDTRYGSEDHGLKMVKIATENLNESKFCIVFFNVYDCKKKTHDMNAIKKALKMISKMKPGLVNLSMDGSASDQLEEYYLKQLVRQNFNLQIAAGNDHLDLSKNCNSFPACYFTGNENRVMIVGNNGKVSNKNGPVNIIDYHYHNGTSESTAYMTRMLLRRRIHE